MKSNVARIAPPLAAALALVAFAVVSCSGKVDSGGSPSAVAVAVADTVASAEHGAYLATIMGCHDCHTPGTLYGAPDFTRSLAGSELGWSGPWGTSYPRNLTPDPETGIASWSEDDIVRALRTGKRPDGTDLRPPMPWPSFAVMKERDIRSIAMYLKALPPIHHTNLEPLPPGQKAKGSVLIMPPPPAWDAPPKPKAS
jgi:mono/diheme cytochrome c family protein